ncbi:NADP oxidoreductase coenzyme F420-dependent [Flavobacteriaceae bacterium Ap0902]|nr:NADP oxidoreductase coenzyme F420-dependent [Flavobacteriaceae bacterium Ap0902]
MNKPQVAIIGLGNIGEKLVRNMTGNGRSLIVADQDKTISDDLAKEIGELAESKSLDDAMKEADVIIMSVPFEAIQDDIKKYSEQLKGKILVDPSNPIKPDGKGNMKKIIGENESSGEIIQGMLPDGVKMAKAFGTLAAPTLKSEANKTPRKVEFYATSDQSIDDQIEDLIRDNGYEPLKVGGIDQSIKIEVFGELHEMGGLEKAVTMDEAQKALDKVSKSS